MVLQERYAFYFVFIFTFARFAYMNPFVKTAPIVQYPEVVPGPGLPSLTSFNLTSAQLYEMPLPTDSTSSFAISMLSVSNADPFPQSANEYDELRTEM
jgi:hypothetical protein